MSRNAKGSENRKKAKVRLSRLPARIGNIRKEGLHQLTTDLTRRFDTLGIEDLNVKGRVKNRHLSRVQRRQRSSFWTHEGDRKLDTDKQYIQYGAAKSTASPKDNLFNTEVERIARHKPSGNTTKGENGRR